MASLTLCYDARVVDHQGAARFLAALCGVLAGG
jgi:pyruvate/2-oxoglutarate dehydrogenase complex dihydrolipoamide acyltransferase (E2) component